MKKFVNSLNISRSEITPEIVKEFIRYDAENGEMFWNKRDVKWFRDDGHNTADQLCRSWNTRCENKKLNTYDSVGYQGCAIFNIKFRVHRLVWAVYYGKWPEVGLIIDHIDGDRKNNKIDNLRCVIPQDNFKNSTLSSKNSSGCSGVSWSKVNNKWRAYITFESKQVHLGVFDSIEEAIKIRKNAEVNYGFHKNHGKLPKGN